MSLTCAQCGGQMKPLFNVGTFCPRDCDRNTVSEDTEFFVPYGSSSRPSVEWTHVATAFSAWNAEQMIDMFFACGTKQLNVFRAKDVVKVERDGADGPFYIKAKLGVHMKYDDFAELCSRYPEYTKGRPY